MRKLATIRKIDAINPIEGADAIEVATVGGWKVVVKKGEFAVGDLAVYFEIDSWIPTSLAPFLSKGKEPHEYEGVKGERLRTIKLRGQISQGLLLPIGAIDDGKFHPEYLDDGFDLTELLGIKKWEKPIHPQLRGMVRGNFPTQIPKTDQERVQNLVKEIANGGIFEVTEKLEGSSMTVYRIKGEFGVCSRNLDLKRDENNAFWKVAVRDKIDEKMQAIDPYWDFAIQGELIGPSIQGNIYGLKDVEFHVFDVYDIQAGDYLAPDARRALIRKMELVHVPVLNNGFVLDGQTVDELLIMAEGLSQIGMDCQREGIVFKEVNGGFTFKAVSNRYLLNSKE